MAPALLDLLAPEDVLFPDEGVAELLDDVPPVTSGRFRLESANAAVGSHMPPLLTTSR